MFVWRDSKKENAFIRAAVEGAIANALRDTEGKLASYTKIDELQKQITKLEIERDKKVEDFARREREVEHKVGLERARHDFETKKATSEATIKVREENLAADKARFKEQMDFQRDQTRQEMESLRDLVKQMMERLPSAEIYADLSRSSEPRGGK